MELSSKYSWWMGYHKTPVVNPPTPPPLPPPSLSFMRPRLYSHVNVTILVIRPPDISRPLLFLVSLMKLLTEPVERWTIFFLTMSSNISKNLSLLAKDLHKLFVCILTRMLICYYVSVNLLQGPSGWCSTMGPTTSTTKTCSGGRDEKVSVNTWRSNALSAYNCAQVHTECIQMPSDAHWVHTNAFKRALRDCKCVQTCT